MADEADYIRKAGSDEKVCLKENGNVVFTIPFIKHTLFSKKTYKQGTNAIITRPHRGLLDQITHVDVRLKDGKFVREVPVDFFRSSLANMRDWWHSHSLFARRRSSALTHR